MATRDVINVDQIKKEIKIEVLKSCQEMFNYMIKKLELEKQEAKADGTPVNEDPEPREIRPTDTRHVLKPVEQGENPDSPDESGSQNSDSTKDKENKDEDKNGDDKSANGGQ